MSNIQLLFPLSHRPQMWRPPSFNPFRCRPLPNLLKLTPQFPFAIIITPRTTLTLLILTMLPSRITALPSAPIHNRLLPLHRHLLVPSLKSNNTRRTSPAHFCSLFRKLKEELLSLFLLPLTRRINCTIGTCTSALLLCKCGVRGRTA